ncbi:reverse transcriptase domain-containing protein [Tanacetum coccineum]
MTHPCPVKKKPNSCKPSVVFIFTMITVTVIQIAIIHVQAEEMITIETTINREQQDWVVDSDEEPIYQELEAHYLYMAKIQEVILVADETFGPIFDKELLEHVQTTDEYNVYAMENEHPVQLPKESTLMCMRTRSQSRNSNRQQQQVNPTFVEPFNLVEPIPVVTMDDTRTMAQLLEAPTVGYEDAIVVPEITADNFELKHGLLTLVQNKQFFGHDKEDPHAHIRYFNKITSTMKFPNVPSSETLPSNTIINPKVDLKVENQKPNSEPVAKVVERKPEVTKDTVLPTNNGSTKDVQPPVIQFQSQVPNSEPVVIPVSAPMPNLKPSIPYPSRRNDEKQREKANDQVDKFYKIFQDMSFEISLADALIRMPKFASTLKALIGNKEKLSKMARTPLNEHCSAVILNKLPKKLGDPGIFLILFVDFDADPRVPLILGRSFLKTRRALIDVYEGKLTLRVGKEAITFNLDQTSRYSYNYDDMTANRIDVIELAYEEYSQEVLGFSNVIASGNPTPYYDPIISTSSPTLTPFGDSDFLLEEVDAFLTLEDDPTLPEVDDSYYDSEGDILLLESFLNDDPSPPPNQGNYLPKIQKELKICEAKTDKSSIDEPPKVELKDLPPHLEYAFLEGDNKFPVIIAKDLSVEEKAALIKVLKSHKRAIAWKLSDIKGINPEFYSHNILMEEDYKPAGGFTVVENDENELIPTRLVTGWRVCIDYRKLNEATRKDHFPLPFMDQMLERLAGNEYYCFLDGFSGYFQIPIDPHDQEKTTFTCPYGTFAYRRMPFGLCNAPGTFQRCMMAIFHDMIEKTMEVFMDDFSVFGNSFENCLSRVDKMLQRCEDTNLCLNWEKSHFMVKEGIVLGHKISKKGIEVDKAKIDVIAKLPHPTTVKGVRSFLGHAGFYRRFIKDFSNFFPTTDYSSPCERYPFLCSLVDCIQAFQTFKDNSTEAPILIALD